MKKNLLLLLAIIATAISCSDDHRSEILKVYNWGDYIDESLIPEFESWYEQQTGEKVKIVYQTFDINETMLSKIEKGKEDYDVVCPSDYIIERMLRNDLILPVSRDFTANFKTASGKDTTVVTPNYIDGNIAPFIKDAFNKIDGGSKRALSYAVPYMWGTTGYLYNPKYVTKEEASTWDAMKNEKFNGHIFLKDAPRDVYAQVLIYLNRDKIASGEVDMDDLMLDSSDESIAAVESYLSDMKDRIAGWEADFGKEMMAQEKGWLNLTWSGDAVFAMENAAESNIVLDYEVPSEGATIWFDGWVVPKYAKNIKAAEYFINFMCRPDNAIKNMDFIGYVSAVGTPEILEAMSSEDDYPETVDVSYFFSPEDTAAHLNPVQYPDLSVVQRCTLEHDWGDDTAKLLAMWSRLKGNDMSNWTIIVIATLVIAAAGVSIKYANSRRRRSSRKRR